MRKTTLEFLRPIMMAGVLAAWPRVAGGAVATNTATPELSLTMPGLVDDSVEKGEPLRVLVRLESSREGTGAVELAPSSGTWVDAIAVELSAAGSNAVLARATPMGAPAVPRATLDRNRVAGGAWLFVAGSTRDLAPGNFVVTARLSIKSSTGWSGEVSSDPLPLRIIAMSPAADRVSARTLVRAQIAFAANAFEDAARLLDGVLATSPDDFDLLCLRADVALSGGNPMAAAICVNRAARMLAPKSPGPPPAVLHDVQSRVRAAQLAREAASGSLPAWTWPPVSVLTLSAKDAADVLGKSSAAPPAAPPGTIAPAPMTPVATAPQPVTAAKAVTVANAVNSATTVTAANSATPSVASSLGTLVPSTELSEPKILADAAGQWAVSAAAGTQYGKTQYSASQATGAPNITVSGNSPNAWCPAVRDKGNDWLEVTFAKPVSATEVRVRQSDAVGALAKVEAIEPDGTAHTWWEGVDPYQQPAIRAIAWFGVRVPPTSYLVARIKLTLNLASGPGYKQIDAVQLVAAP